MVELRLECDGKCNDACGEVRELRAKCQKLRAENIELKSQTNNLETYSRRDNLKIYGIPEHNGETASVRDLFVKKLQLTVHEVNDIAFVRCHRLYRPRRNTMKPISLISQRSNNFFRKKYLLKVFLISGNFGGLLHTTWQRCCGNISNDLGIGLDI